MFASWLHSSGRVLLLARSCAHARRNAGGRSVARRLAVQKAAPRRSRRSGSKVRPTNRVVNLNAGSFSPLGLTTLAGLWRVRRLPLTRQVIWTNHDVGIFVAVGWKVQCSPFFAEVPVDCGGNMHRRHGRTGWIPEPDAVWDVVENEGLL